MYILPFDIAGEEIDPYRYLFQISFSVAISTAYSFFSGFPVAKYTTPSSTVGVVDT
jgi:hypothetical protein